MKYMNFIIWIIAIIILIMNSSYLSAKILDQAIVIIENDVITQSEYQKKLSFIINQYRISGKPLPKDRGAFNKKVLDHMVSNRLQIQFAEKYGMEVQEWMIDKAMEDIAQKSGLNLSTFRDELIKNNIDYKTYRDVLKEDLITREVKRRVISQRIKISKKEIEEFLEHQSHVFKENNQYKISNILISLTETASNNEKIEAKNKIKMIKDKFFNKEKFSSLAKNYSDSGNAMSGGDLGWRKLSEVPKIFLKELENLKKGEISNIIETANGYYIFYLENKKEIQNVEIEERKVRHILIKKNAIVTDNIAQKKLLELKKRIENGESFSDLARAHSDDTMSAATGGELDWTGPGSFVPEFEDKIDTLPLKKISKPFSTQYGWHILEVIERRKQDNTEVIMQNLAKQYITSSRSGEVIDAWLIEIKEKSFIRYINENNNQVNNIIINNINSPQQLWDPFSE